MPRPTPAQSALLQLMPCAAWVLVYLCACFPTKLTVSAWCRFLVDSWCRLFLDVPLFNAKSIFLWCLAFSYYAFLTNCLMQSPFPVVCFIQSLFPANLIFCI